MHTCDMQECEKSVVTDLLAAKQHEENVEKQQQRCLTLPQAIT